jgi:CheY-like chemotaxis protein
MDPQALFELVARSRDPLATLDTHRGDITRSWRMRAEPCCDDMLLVAVTGYGQEEDRRRSQEAGVDEHLVKTVSVAELERVLAHPKLDREGPDAP